MHTHALRSRTDVQGVWLLPLRSWARLRKSSSCKRSRTGIVIDRDRIVAEERGLGRVGRRHKERKERKSRVHHLLNSARRWSVKRPNGSKPP